MKKVYVDQQALQETYLDEYKIDMPLGDDFKSYCDMRINQACELAIEQQAKNSSCEIVYDNVNWSYVLHWFLMEYHEEVESELHSHVDAQDLANMAYETKKDKEYYNE